MRCSLALALTLTLLFTHNASAAVSYSTAESVYSESFNGLPTWTAPNGFLIPYNASAHIQTNTAANGGAAAAPFPGGWKDDSTTDNTNLGVPGWYLWSDVTSLTTATGGVNSHAQVRYGGGNNAGGTGFFVFGFPLCQSGCGEKSLGIRSASAFTDSNAGRRSYIGLQLINDTTETLNSFTITYDGEQFSEATGTGQDGFDLQWSLVTTAAGWKSSSISEVGGFYDGVSGVDYGGVAAADPGGFLSPVNTNPGTATFFDGDVNHVADIAHTVSGIEWEPGAELWIRWRDGDAHDGIAIDNVRFTASAATVVPIAGDFNNDGKVDAGDYVTWRKNEVANATLPNDGGATDQAARYALWSANFGNPPGAGSGSGLESANVPEPSAIALVLLCLAALPLKQARVR